MARRHLAHLRRDELLNRDKGPGWPLVGCAVLLTAGVAFPAGLWVARTMTQREAPRAPAASRTSTPFARNPYSVDVLADPYVAAKHLELVEMLERQCAQTGDACAQARQARAAIARARD